MQYARVEPRNAFVGTWMLGEGFETPRIYHIYGYKEKKQNNRTTIRNAACELYILFTHMQFFFSKKDLYLGGIISKGTYNQRDLFVLNLMGL